MNKWIYDYVAILKGVSDFPYTLFCSSYILGIFMDWKMWGWSATLHLFNSKYTFLFMPGWAASSIVFNSPVLWSHLTQTDDFIQDFIFGLLIELVLPRDKAMNEPQSKKGGKHHEELLIWIAKGSYFSPCPALSVEGSCSSIPSPGWNETLGKKNEYNKYEWI